MEQLYRIEELATSGWALIDADKRKMTKQQCSEALMVYINSGYNPNTIRAVPDNDP